MWRRRMSGPISAQYAAGHAAVLQADAAGVHASDPDDLALELQVDVRSDEHVELRAGDQRLHSFVGRSRRHELLIAARRAVTDEDAADPRDLDADRAGE